MKRRKLIVGNWKMNGQRASNAELLAALKASGPWVAEVAVCAPFPYLADVALSLQGEAVAWGAQDCSAHESGAYTGEVAAAMIAEFGFLALRGNPGAAELFSQHDLFDGGETAAAVFGGPADREQVVVA